MYTNLTPNLMVENVEESLAFYRDILGFSLIDSVPSPKGGLQFAIINRDGLILMLQERENLMEEYPSLGTPKVQPSVTLYIMVDQLEAYHATLKSKCPILVDMHETFYGAKEFAVADNTGYVLTFTEAKQP